jgi:thioredoxin-dependent peroxiredoxin
VNGPNVGEAAPDFSLPDQAGELVSLSSFRGKALVLFFYPGAFTPGCTAEACSFRDQHEAFSDAGAAVIGISGNAAGTQAAFASMFKLPFTLLTDAGGAVRSRYNVRSSLGLLPGRVSFVIDAGGIVRHRFESQVRVTAHVREALKVVRALQEATGG